MRSNYFRFYIKIHIFPTSGEKLKFPVKNLHFSEISQLNSHFINFNAKFWKFIPNFRASANSETEAPPEFRFGVNTYFGSASKILGHPGASSPGRWRIFGNLPKNFIRKFQKRTIAAYFQTLP